MFIHKILTQFEIQKEYEEFFNPDYYRYSRHPDGIYFGEFYELIDDYDNDDRDEETIKMEKYQDEMSELFGSEWDYEKGAQEMEEEYEKNILRSHID